MVGILKDFCIIFLTIISAIVEMSTASNQNYCLSSNQSDCKFSDTNLYEKMTRILLVGIVSMLVFGLVGTLPSFFIRTQKDVEKFSKSK
jgi:hypothetical protein